jgi:hypothetical protein
VNNDTVEKMINLVLAMPEDKAKRILCDIFTVHSTKDSEQLHREVHNIFIQEFAMKIIGNSFDL